MCYKENIKPVVASSKQGKENKVTAYILAGGKSKRIKTNFSKAFLKLGKMSVVENLIARITPLFKEVILITNDYSAYKHLGLKMVKDLVPKKSSLGGIYTGLKLSSTFHNFFFACDMPFVNTNLVRFFLKNRKGYDVIIPQVKNKLEPLHSIYSKDCIKFIEKQLRENDLKIINFFPEVRVKYIKEAEIKKIDGEFLSFFNINTPADYKIAQKIYKKVKG